MPQTQEDIAPVFKKLHFNSENIHAIGQFRAERGKGLISFLLGLPFSIHTRGKRKSFGLTIEKDKKKEVWTRLFDTKVFITKVVNKEMLIRERYGIFEFDLSLIQKDHALGFQLDRIKILKIGLPKRLSIMSSAVCQSLNDSEWSFDVDVKTSSGRRIIRYWGQASILNG